MAESAPLLAELRKHCNDQWRICVCEPAWGLYCDSILPVAKEFAEARHAEVMAAGRAQLEQAS